jgi:hypothetical protein
MSARLKKNFALLQALVSATTKTRRAIIATSPDQLILAIAECVDNLLNGNVDLKRQEQKRLRKYRVILRQIASKKVKNNKKRATLIQHGGALPLLLIPALTAVASIIGEVIRR